MALVSMRHRERDAAMVRPHVGCSARLRHAVIDDSNDAVFSCACPGTPVFVPSGECVTLGGFVSLGSEVF